MPYIRSLDRGPLEAGAKASTPGELNFVLTFMCDEYVQGKGLSYTTLNEVIGALECAKLEFYRRLVVPYEESKIEQNGDVYSPQNRTGDFR